MGGRPFYIHTVFDMTAQCARTQDANGAWVAPVAVPYPANVWQRLMAGLWVFLGKAHAIRWPETGDLEHATRSYKQQDTRHDT